MLGEVKYIMIITASSRVGAHLVKKSTREIMCASKCTGAVNLTEKISEKRGLTEINSVEVGVSFSF